jgi:hypothetical protein
VHHGEPVGFETGDGARIVQAMRESHPQGGKERVSCLPPKGGVDRAEAIDVGRIPTGSAASAIRTG